MITITGKRRKVIGTKGIIAGKFYRFEIKVIYFDTNTLEVGEEVEMRIEVDKAAYGMIENLFFKTMENLTNTRIEKIKSEKKEGIEIDMRLYDTVEIFTFKKENEEIAEAIKKLDEKLEILTKKEHELFDNANISNCEYEAHNKIWFKTLQDRKKLD